MTANQVNERDWFSLVKFFSIRDHRVHDIVCRLTEFTSYSLLRPVCRLLKKTLDAKNGLECWSNGVLGLEPITPPLQYSIPTRRLSAPFDNVLGQLAHEAFSAGLLMNGRRIALRSQGRYR
jgi:hypothetical protein